MGESEALISKGQPLKKLLVEGADDANVCYHLFTSYHIAVKDRDAKKASIMALR